MTQPKKKALGRGLDALISTDGLVRTQGSSSICEIPTDRIHANPDQPRREFDPESLAELAESVKELGIIQPITLRKVNENDYQIIAGERRFRSKPEMKTSSGLRKNRGDKTSSIAPVCIRCF